MFRNYFKVCVCVCIYYIYTVVLKYDSLYKFVHEQWRKAMLQHVDMTCSGTIQILLHHHTIQKTNNEYCTKHILILTQSESGHEMSKSQSLLQQYTSIYADNYHGWTGPDLPKTKLNLEMSWSKAASAMSRCSQQWTKQWCSIMNYQSWTTCNYLSSGF